jgi:hypothetical protein
VLCEEKYWLGGVGQPLAVARCADELKTHARGTLQHELTQPRGLDGIVDVDR